MNKAVRTFHLLENKNKFGFGGGHNPA